MKEALAIDEANGDPGPIAASLSNLGRLADMRGDLRSSRNYARRAIDLIEVIDTPSDFDLRRRASLLINLAHALRQLGEYDAMEPLYERVLELTSETHTLYETGRAHYGLAEVALQRRDHDEAEARLAAGLEAADRAGDLTLRSRIEELSAWCAHDRGDPHEALAAIRRAVKASSDAGAHQDSSAIYASAAFFADEGCLTIEADDYLSRSVESSGSEARRIHVDELRACLALRRSDLALAVDIVNVIDESCRQTGYVRSRVLQDVADRTRSAIGPTAR